MGDPITTPPSDITPLSRVRSPTIRLCVATSQDGSPCRGAAMRGSDRCKHHSEHEARTKAQAAADTIKVSPLPELVSLDVTDPLILKRFRKGIMAHVARQTLGVQEARALLDVALSIYESERRERPPTAMSTLTAALRRAMKSEATPTGEGGDSQPSDEAKDVKARIATDPK